MYSYLIILKILLILKNKSQDAEQFTTISHFYLFIRLVQHSALLAL